MRRLLPTLLAAGLLWAGPAFGLSQTEADLLLDRAKARPGETVTAGVRLRMPPGWHTYADPSGDSGQPTEIRWSLPPGVTAGRILWPEPRRFEDAGIKTFGYEDEAVLLVPLSLAPDLKPGRLDLEAAVSWLECRDVCIDGKADVAAALEVGGESVPSADAAVIEAWRRKVPGAAAVAPPGDGTGPPPQAPAGETTLPAALGLALLGGLLLNAMPCVLPVLALKVLSFVRQGGESPGRARRLALVYAAGVLGSFAALALAVVAVRGQASWGMQLQEPRFVVGMAALVTLVALNLFGVFEVSAGGRVAEAAGTLAAREGPAGAFFHGAFTTLLATPCTAPFLAVALGYAFTQPPASILAIFLATGTGLAAPYVLASFFPAMLRILPRPGPWMERFKALLGFPMLATGVWLLSLTGAFYGDRGPLWTGLFLVALALAAWTFGEFFQRRASRRGLALAASAVLLGGGYGGALERGLDWRHPPEGLAAGPEASPSGIDWRPWGPEAVAAGRAAGRIVLVDFTARWCQTCLWNEVTSLETAAVRERLAAGNVLALRADYTRRDSRIRDELLRHRRAGVPLVLVYPRDPAAPPIVLPTLLTPGIVLEALDAAGR